MEHEVTLSGFAIAVCDRGFVYVGQCEVDGSWCIITGARNIRAWGTERGLGQLAQEGPQENTRIDDVGTVRIPIRGLMHLIDTEEGKWS